MPSQSAGAIEERLDAIHSLRPLLDDNPPLAIERLYEDLIDFASFVLWFLALLL